MTPTYRLTMSDGRTITTEINPAGDYVPDVDCTRCGAVAGAYCGGLDCDDAERMTADVVVVVVGR